MLLFAYIYVILDIVYCENYDASVELSFLPGSRVIIYNELYLYILPLASFNIFMEAQFQISNQHYTLLLLISVDLNLELLNHPRHL